MGSVVKFRPRRRRPSHSVRAGRKGPEAEILFFTGVRRERIETAASSVKLRRNGPPADGRFGR